jgi:transcription elongation factor GreA
MSDAAFRRLTDEESRLSGLARELSMGGPHDEAPDAAVVATSIREADAIGRRLAAVQAAVAAAEITEAPDEAVIGRTVRIQEDGLADAFRLVIPGAGDPANGTISIESPLGGALVGSRPGDRIEYATPSGIRSAVVESVDEGEGTPF